MQYQWPGNVRELRTAIEHAVVLCRGDKITARDLPPAVRAGAAGASGGGSPIRALARSDMTVKEAERAAYHSRLEGDRRKPHAGRPASSA